MDKVDAYAEALQKQALSLFNAWTRKTKNEWRDLIHTECLDDLVLDIYRTEHKRDLALDEAITDLLIEKRSTNVPANAHAVALANLRYEDAI